MKYLIPACVWAYLQLRTAKRWPEERRLRKQLNEIGAKVEASGHNSEEAKDEAWMAVALILAFAVTGKATLSSQEVGAPKFGEYLLYLFLSKKEREYLIGDLAEEYLEVRAKFGRRRAEVWYYKQVVASAWPLIRKGLKWGLLASVFEMFRGRI